MLYVVFLVLSGSGCYKLQSCLLPVLNSEAHFEKLAQNEIIMLMSCKIIFFLYNREYITDKRVSIQNVACSH